MPRKTDNAYDFYRAQLIYYLTLLLFVVSTTLFTLGQFVAWLNTTEYLLLFVAVSLASFYLLSRGHIQWASLLLVTSMWLFTTFIMLTSGIYNPVIHAYMVIILLAGAIFNERTVLITSILSALAILTGGLLTVQAVMAPQNSFIQTQKLLANPQTVYGDTFGFLSNLAFFALLTYVVVRQTRLVFERVEENRQLLNEQNSVLEQVNKQLRHEIDEREHYEQALQVSEQRFRELFEGAPIMYVVTTPDEQNQPRIQECNQLFLNLLGYEVADVVGQPLQMFYSDHSRELLIAQGGYERILLNETVEGERELLTAVGNILPVWLRAIPKYNDHGRVIGTRAMYVDISSLKQAQLQAQAYNQQLATMHRLHVEMTRTLNLDQVANTLLKSLQHELQADYASLFLIEDYFHTLAQTYNYKHWQDPQRGQIVMVNPYESPIFSEIVSHKTSLIIAETTTHPHWIQVVGAEKIRSFIAVPLLVDDEVVAFCGLDKNRPHYFTAEHLRLVESLAGQAAMALENTRLHTILQSQATELEQRVAERTAALETANQRLLGEVEQRRQMQAQLIVQNQQLNVMRHLGLELAAELELSQLLNMIVMAAIELMAGDGGRLYLVHEKQAESSEAAHPAVEYLHAHVTVGQANIPVNTRFYRGQAVSGRIWESKQPLIIHDYPHWEHLAPPHSAEFIQSIIGVPIMSQAEVVGVLLIVATDSHAFSNQDVHLLELFAAHAAVAIRNAQLHEQIQQYNDQLEQRVRERTQELITANLKLRELDELKTKFMHDMSHELRTPVTNVGLYLDLLERKPTKLPTYLVTLRNQYQRLRELVTQVVEMSDLEVIEEYKQPQQVEMHLLVAQLLEKHQERAQAKQLTLVNKTPTTAVPPIHGNPHQLTQMLNQLLDNALKYSHQGEISVTLTHQPAAQTIQIKIQDSGAGIPAAELDHIFDSFYRGQNISQLTIPGVGLGLTTAKAIAEMHHGRIEIESELGQGTAVVVTLPTIPTLIQPELTTPTTLPIPSPIPEQTTT